MQLGIDNPWTCLSCVEGSQEVMSLSYHQSHVWTDYVGDMITQLM